MPKWNVTTGLITWGVALAVTAQAQIEKIGEIQHTPREAAASGIPVRIEAQVTHLHPQRAGLFLFDGERGIYVELPQAAGSFKNLKVGAMVRVEGVTAIGRFVPHVAATEITVTGWSPLPEPRQIHFFELFLPNTELDATWLSVWGRLVDVRTLPDYDYLLVELEIHGLRVNVQIPYSAEALAKVHTLMFQRVMVPAVLGTVHNRHLQMTDRTFLVNSPDDFVVIAESSERIDQGALPIDMLMRAEIDSQRNVRTRGLVTYAEDNSVYLRGVETSLKVATLGGTQVQPGDYVEMLGLIWLQPISPAFRARQITVLERRNPPTPMEVDLERTLNSDWCYELIRTDAQLIDIGETFGLARYSSEGQDMRVDGGRVSLLCRSGERVFEARLPSPMAPASDLRPGAELRLTGICHLVPNRDPRWSHFAEGVWLELRLEDGIKVLRPAPWWTTRRLIGGIVIVLAIAGLFLFWVVLLRKTVVRQTGVIGQQIERASIQKERQRIARELHDTVEQSLAATSYQLQNSLKQIDSDPEIGKESLRLALAMLRYCREESRDSVIEMRGGPLETSDLPTALEKAIRPLATECGADLTVTMHGHPRRLKPFAERQLFRIAKEAASNAARHASPKHIRVELRYEPTLLSLTVSDDGAGFHADRVSKRERFGLQGMRERANHMNGSLDIESVIGQGTTIRVEVSSTREWELS